LQTNIPQGIRNDRDVAGARADEAVESMMAITHRMAAQAIRGGRPDLIVWPETTFPDPWRETGEGAPNTPERAQWESDLLTTQREIRQVADNLGTNALLGLNTHVFGAGGKTHLYNSALLVTPGGDRPAGRYDKMHLVPFGEYVPFRDTIPLLKKLAPYDYDFSLAAGEKPTRFRMTTHDGRSFTFGALICYEDSDAPLARAYARSGGGPPVDFLVNLSNDGWFMGTSEHEEHLAVSRFRTVECRRALVRAVNMGVSAVVDANGRVVNLPGETWRASKGVEAIVTATVPIDSRMSLYAYAGDWLPWACWAGLAYGCSRRHAESPHGRG
jgi:apolipoprotein N-acyltransferase